MSLLYYTMERYKNSSCFLIADWIEMKECLYKIFDLTGPTQRNLRSEVVLWVVLYCAAIANVDIPFRISFSSEWLAFPLYIPQYKMFEKGVWQWKKKSRQRRSYMTSYCVCLDVRTSLREMMQFKLITHSFWLLSGVYLFFQRPFIIFIPPFIVNEAVLILNQKFTTAHACSSIKHTVCMYSFLKFSIWIFQPFQFCISLSVVN